jgi:hypothetical protein
VEKYSRNHIIIVETVKPRITNPDRMLMGVTRKNI